MAKTKKKKNNKSPGAGGNPTKAAKVLSPREQGLIFFKKQNYVEAIHHWESLPLDGDAALKTAIAEAWFRRGLASAGHESSMASLRQAAKLAPAEPRYFYHLALALHNSDQLTKALQIYEQLAASESIPGLAEVRALAELEIDPRFDLQGHKWIPDATRAALQPVATLLREEAFPTGDNAISPLWRGLDALRQEDAETARTLLTADDAAVLHPMAEQVRAFYYGLAQAQLGKPHAAVQAWDEARAAARKAKIALLPQLETSIEWAMQEVLRQLHREQRWNDLSREARRARELLPEAKLPVQMQTLALHQVALQATRDQQWKEAEVQWQQLLTVLEQDGGEGSQLPVAKNLALLNELQNKPEKAAKLWEKVLFLMPKVTRPRKTIKREVKPSELEKRNRALWIHHHVIELFYEANLPQRALDHHKRIVELSPDDLEQRLRYVETLESCGVYRQAKMEFQKILKRDSNYVPALLKQADTLEEDYELDLAENVYRKILRIEPENKIARDKLCEFLTDRAIDESNITTLSLLTEAHELNPQDMKALLVLADCEAQSGLIKQSTEHYEEALKSGNTSAYNWLFTKYAQEKDRKGAQSILEKAASDGHLSLELLAHFASSCLGLEPACDDPEWIAWGEELAQQAIRKESDEFEGYRAVVEIFAKSTPKIAMRYARKLVDLYPKNARSHMLLALTYLEEDNTKEALAALSVAEEITRKTNDRETWEMIQELREVAEMAGIIRVRKTLIESSY